MGREARENQGQLFETRHERSELFIALTMAICGDPADVAAAKQQLLNYAADPVMGKIILTYFEGREDMHERFPEVFDLAALNAKPPALLAPGQFAQRF